MFKRHFTHVPLWVDLTYRVVRWVTYSIERGTGRAYMWASELVDRHCECEKCQERARATVKA